MKTFYFTYRDNEWVARVTAKNLAEASVLLNRALSTSQEHPQVVFEPMETQYEMWSEGEEEETK